MIWWHVFKFCVELAFMWTFILILPNTFWLNILNNIFIAFMLYDKDFSIVLNYMNVFACIPFYVLHVFVCVLFISPVCNSIIYVYLLCCFSIKYLFRGLKWKTRDFHAHILLKGRVDTRHWCIIGKNFFMERTAYEVNRFGRKIRLTPIWKNTCFHQ